MLAEGFLHSHKKPWASRSCSPHLVGPTASLSPVVLERLHVLLFCLVMFWQFPLLYCLSIPVHWASAALSDGTLVSFANIRSAEPAAFQVCKTEREASVCCEPLDIDINDGKGFGWFRAELVTFSYIESPSTVTKIFGRHSLRPCSSDVITTKQGGRNWRMDVPDWGAGSASVVKDPSQQGALTPKYPEVVTIGNIRYTFVMEDTSRMLHYMGQDGHSIIGRRFQPPVLRLNRTAVDA